MNFDSVFSLIKNHDPQAFSSKYQFSAREIDRLEASLPHLDEESRQLAVGLLRNQKGQKVANLLLRLTSDPDSDVSDLAATTLETFPDLPDLTSLAASISKQPDSFIRGELYLVMGRYRDVNALDRLRRFWQTEKDRDASTKYIVAAVKLGGASERRLLLERVRETQPEDAVNLCDDLMYIGDSELARGLVVWLADNSNVTRLGSDRNPRMARMCDLAAWTAHKLGIEFDLGTKYLTNFPDSILQNAKKAIEMQTKEQQ